MFTMPPALAGDSNEVDASSEGARNWVSVAGGLTLVLVALAVAAGAKNRIMALAGQKSGQGPTLTVN